MPVPATLTTARHQDFDLKVVSGTMPTDISGDILFSSPQQGGRLPFAIFDWGAMCRLSLDPGTRGASPEHYRWQSRSIETPGKRLYDRHPDLFTSSPVGFVSPFGPPNAANTAPLPWGKRLFATWDAGRPVELNPETLEFVSEVGHADTWNGDSLAMGGVLPFLLSSAHPVADPERDCLWTTKLNIVFTPSFGMAPSLVRWDRKDGNQVKVFPLEGITFSGSTHTVSQTRNWVIICDSGNFKADPNQMMGQPRTVTVDSEIPLWLIRKDQVETLASGTPVRPICFTVSPPSGHYYAKYNDDDGVSVVWEGMDLMDLGLYLAADDVDVNGNPIPPSSVGLYNMAMAPETITELVFDPETGRVIEKGLFKQDWTFNLQLSAMDWSTEGITAPTLHHVNFQGCRPANISMRAADLYQDRIDLGLLREETPGALCSFERDSMRLKSRWDYPDLEDHITSPTFVPRSATPGSYNGAEPGGHHGYIVQPVANDGGLRVEIFDAAAVSAGPIATLKGTNNECIPLILHSAWMPVSNELADAQRLRFSSELTESRLGSVPEELRPSVLEVARECDAILD